MEIKFKPGYGQQEDIYKAHFVAKGFSKVPGLDFNEDEIYSPVINHDSLRIILSIAASLDLELHQLDIKTAFLYGDLEEELYVQQPEGFVKPREENLVCASTSRCTAYGSHHGSGTRNSIHSLLSSAWSTQTWTPASTTVAATTRTTSSE